MPRTARACVGGYTYHVLNRGNARATVFHKPDDFDAFLAMMAEASIRVPMRVLAYCLMPNHFHLALWPHADGELSRWMHWLMTDPCPPLPPALSIQWPRVARSVQSISDSGG